MTTVDLSAEYCETAEWLNGTTGLSERITVVHADALDLSFADGSFDVVWSQHAQMNIADKRRLFHLRGSGRDRWPLEADDHPFGCRIPSSV